MSQSAVPPTLLPSLPRSLLSYVAALKLLDFGVDETVARCVHLQTGGRGKSEYEKHPWRKLNKYRHEDEESWE